MSTPEESQENRRQDADRGAARTTADTAHREERGGLGETDTPEKPSAFRAVAGVDSPEVAAAEKRGEDEDGPSPNMLAP